MDNKSLLLVNIYNFIILRGKYIYWEILVETSQAGPGNLEVTVNGGRVPTSAQAQGPHTYAISFTPRQPTVHTVHLRFNNHDVPGKVKFKNCIYIVCHKLINI